MSNELLKEGAVVKLNKNLELSKDIYWHDFNPIKYFDMVGVVEGVDCDIVVVRFSDNELWCVQKEDLLIVFEHAGIQSALPQDVEYVYYFDGTDPDGEETIVGYKSNFEYYVDDQSEWTFLDDYSVADYLRKYGVCIYNKDTIARPLDNTTVVVKAPIKSDGVIDDVGYNPLTLQADGSHYKSRAIQPIEYSERNGLSMCQGNIVKYVTRHKEKSGIIDLEKVVHYALLEAYFVYGDNGSRDLKKRIEDLIGK